MIFDAIISLVVSAFTALLSLIPSFSLPAGAELGARLGQWYDTANGFFPVGSVFLCLSGVLITYVFVFVVRVIVFVWDKFPFKAS